MLALTVAEALLEMEEGGVKETFRRNHPGGAIGAASTVKKIKVESTLVTLPG